MNWNDHARSIILKSSKLLNLLRRSLQGSSKEAKLKSYNAIVRPHLEYCCPVWQPHQIGILSELEKIQKRGARWIMGSRWNKCERAWSTPYTQCKQLLKWPSLENRYHIYLVVKCTKSFTISTVWNLTISSSLNSLVHVPTII